MPRSATVILSVVAGVAVVVVLGLVLAGGDDEVAETSPGTEATETAPPVVEPVTTDPAPEPVTLLIRIRDGQPVDGIQRLTVEQGETVSIRVVSDVADELHVHGYDVTGEIEPEGTTELEFAATIPGRFEIELERTHTLVGELEVRP